jgi:RES domain
VRAHASTYGATEFNPSADPGRFRPVRGRGRVVPTLYGSEGDAGAISETVFHAVPVAAPHKRVLLSRFDAYLLSVLATRRPLRLAQLHGHGFHRIHATRAALIESDPDRYGELAAWGQALHDCPAEPDGIVWRSRQYDDSYALILFGDRVSRRELRVVKPPLPLAFGAGLERVQELAERARITLIE